MGRPTGKATGVSPALDTSTPSGQEMFGMLGVFAEFERSIIQERIKAGLARAQAGS